MANPSKGKGTRAETKVKRYFNQHGLPTERKALAGSKDEGDLRTILPDGTEIAVEVKAGIQTSNPSRTQMNRWKGQTIAEALNSHCMAILVIVRYNRLFKDTEVWIPNTEEYVRYGWTMMHIDEFVKMMTQQEEEEW